MTYYPRGHQRYFVSYGNVDLGQTSILHPDSYIRSRPNFRSGFGGNYSRPDAGIRKSSRPVSLERQTALLCGRPSSTGSGISSNGCIDRPHPSPSPLPLVCSRPPSAVSHSTFRPSNFCLSQSHLAVPTITWTAKTSQEEQNDQKLLNIIHQLPSNRQNTLGLVLLRMNIEPKAELDTAPCGLEYRLRQALQLVPPTTMNGDLASEIDKHSRSLKADPDASHAPTSHAPSECRLDPRMTQSCYQRLETGPFNGVPEKSPNSKEVHQNHTDNVNERIDQPITTSTTSMSIRSGSDVDQLEVQDPPDSDELFGEHQPCVTTVLRHLNRYLATRIAHKRQQLANAQQQLSRNNTEEKWLRGQLNDLFTLADHSTSWCSHSDNTSTMTKTCDSPGAQVVTRFDRWHNNVTSVIQLLCQLARRLAWIDARLGCANPHPVGQLNGNVDRSTEELNRQKTDLEFKIKEAQDLKAGLGNCRLRLLESIPPGLKVERFASNYMSSDKDTTDATTTVLSGYSDCSSPSSQTAAPKSRKSMLLRDRVAVHLLSTLYWLVRFHMLDTHIRVDQEVSDSILDDLQLELDH